MSGRASGGQEVVFHLARADNGVIGDGGRIPWRIRGEQARFKARTMGRAMVMGRKTFESLPAPLPGRRHVVLTRRADWRAAGAEVARTPEEALALAGGGEVAVIGGAEVFAVFLDRADRVEVTEVHCTPDGDAVVPPFAGWREAAREEHAAEGGQPAYAFVTLVRP